MQPGQRMGGTGGGMASNSPGGRQSNPWDRAEEWNGTDPRGAEVELSHPDDFVTPEAFRALIQEEAAGEAPERYVPLNNSYYEELVK